jgi:hypothetical protein
LSSEVLTFIYSFNLKNWFSIGIWFKLVQNLKLSKFNYFYRGFETILQVETYLISYKNNNLKKIDLNIS